jgi:peptide/nickel transport system permease protein
MGRYIVRRLIGAAGVLVVVSIVAFAVFQVVPVATGGSPAYLYVGRVASEAQVAAVEKQLGFDKPIVNQYLDYVSGIFTGREVTDGDAVIECPAPCLGYSFRYNQSVSSLIVERFPVTLSLAIGALVLWLVMGISIGVMSALRKGSFLDRAGMVFALAGVSLPVYFTGYVLLLIFSYGPPWLQLFPDVRFVPFTDNPSLWFQNLVLPWFSLALLYAALYARLTRANMLETMGEDYIRTARAKGLPERTVVRRHAMRAALTPIVTIIGLDLGALLGGAVLTETTFSFPGLGRLSYEAISQQDLPVIMGVTLVAALFIVLANVVVDVVYAYLDPRVSYA